MVIQEHIRLKGVQPIYTKPQWLDIRARRHVHFLEDWVVLLQWFDNLKKPVWADIMIKCDKKVMQLLIAILVLLILMSLGTKGGNVKGRVNWIGMWWSGRHFFERTLVSNTTLHTTLDTTLATSWPWTASGRIAISTWPTTSSSWTPWIQWCTRHSITISVTRASGRWTFRWWTKVKTTSNKLILTTLNEINSPPWIQILHNQLH